MNLFKLSILSYELYAFSVDTYKHNLVIAYYGSYK